jgi:cytochrome c oxidase subunit 4
MSLRGLLLTYAGLLLLLSANVLLALLLPAWSSWVLLGAAGQAALVIIGFMQLGTHSALVRFFALGAGFWLLLVFSLTLADLLTRGGG